jgi:hypothetical protein
MTEEKWLRPQKIKNIDTMFGIIDTVIDIYLPKWTELPMDFRREIGEAKKWINIVDDLFFCGARNIRCVVKDPTIDQVDIMRHVSMLLHSFEPSHEHKTAGVAYLLSLWCTDITYTRMGGK